MIWLFPALGWGMGFAMHGLTYRSWLQENERDIALAERKLGRVGAGGSLQADRTAEGRAGDRRRGDHRRRVARDHRQGEARDRARRGRARRSAAPRRRQRRAAAPARRRDDEHRAAGGRRERITDALDEIAPDGGAHLETEIDAIDSKINSASDDQLKEVYLANRTMLVARQKKLEALNGERARMKANAEGFLIAAENVRLDIAGLTSGVSPAQARKAMALVEPVRRLTEEVEILRKVEAELKQFS